MTARKSRYAAPSSLRMPPELKEKLKAQAYSEGKAMSNLVIELLRSGLALRKLEERQRPKQLLALKQAATSEGELNA